MLIQQNLEAESFSDSVCVCVSGTGVEPRGLQAALSLGKCSSFSLDSFLIRANLRGLSAAPFQERISNQPALASVARSPLSPKKKQQQQQLPGHLAVSVDL